MKPHPQRADNRRAHGSAALEGMASGLLHPSGLGVRLRALHDLIPLALEFPALAYPYLELLRELRERLHPLGVSDQRIIETASGLRFRVDLGSRVGGEIFYGFVAELFDFALFSEMLDEGLAVADVGANFGLYALSAARRVGPTGRVHAFEPDPAAFALLSGNARANDLTNVVYHEICIAESDGHRDFCVMEDSAFSGLTMTGRSRLRETRVVTARRLDSVLAEAQVASLGALKVDVEGHEFGVLRGARETIGRSGEIVMMLEVSSKNLDADRKGALEAEVRALYAQGFSGWVADPCAEGLRRLADPQEAANLGSANLFLARAGTAREDQLRAAAQELRGKALTGITASGAIADDASLSRRKLDEGSGLAVHTALFSAVLADRETRLSAAKQESEARLAEIRRLTDRALKIEDDSQSRLRQIHTLGENLRHARHEADRTRTIQKVAEREGRERLEEIKKLRETMLAIETDSQARLREIYQLAAEAQRWRLSAEAETAARETAENQVAALWDEIRRLEEEDRKLREAILAIEADSQARLLEIHRLAAEGQHWRLSAEAETAGRETAEREVAALRDEVGRLSEDIERARREAERPLASLIWRRIRRRWR